MKTSLSFLVSLSLFAAVVIVPAFPFTFTAAPHRRLLFQRTCLWDKMQAADRFSSGTKMPSNRTSADAGGDADTVNDAVAQRMLTLLEETDVNFVTEAHAASADKKEEFDPAKQIFDPLSFWTERSGRFPRNK